MSNNFKLNIGIDPASLTQMTAANQSLIIVKGSSVGTSVAWLVFNPFMMNTVTWQEDFLLYASRTLIEAGATIDMVSQSGPASNIVFDFSAGQFFPTTMQALPNSFGVVNQMAEPLTFGLSQAAKVSGQMVPFSPINATQVPSSSTASFTPIQTVTVFAQADIQTSNVIGTVTGPSISVNFTEASTASIFMENMQWVNVTDPTLKLATAPGPTSTLPPPPHGATPPHGAASIRRKYYRRDMHFLDV